MSSLVNQIIIRHATYTDLPTLEWDGEFTHFRRIFAEAYHMMEKGEAIMWVVDLTEVGLIGQLFVQMYPQGSLIHENRPYAYIYGFRVKPDFRGQGVGSRLLAVTEADLIRRKFRMITLNVARDNLKARRLYERFGYRVVSAEPGIWSYIDEKGRRKEVNEPAWRMEKEI